MQNESIIQVFFIFPDFQFRLNFMKDSDLSPRSRKAQSSLSVHLEKVDILVPLPKPKFGSSSLDSMVRLAFQ